MSTWSANELNTIGAADEVEITSPRADGTPRRYVRIWIVQVGDELYVRSVRGRDGAWFRHAVQRGEGRIRAGRLEHDVTLSQADDTVNDAIDQAYRTKYGRYGDSYVDPMVGPDARATTLRLTAR